MAQLTRELYEKSKGIKQPKLKVLQQKAKQKAKEALKSGGSKAKVAAKASKAGFLAGLKWAREHVKVEGVIEGGRHKAHREPVRVKARMKSRTTRVRTSSGRYQRTTKSRKYRR